MALYSFEDTTANNNPTAAGTPAEALKINGVYIENQISGYRTLYVKGRELIGNDIESYQVGDTPGSYYRQKRMLSRTITVGYQIMSDSTADFRTKFNNLNKMLNFEQAQLIFADELDKYFIGTKATVTDVQVGRLCVTGEFAIFCADPYKYSTTVKTFAFTSSGGELTATVANAGTVPVAIDYTITNNSENGLIGIVGQNGVMQFGYPDETDTATAEMSETLLNVEDGDDFMSASFGSDIDTYTEFDIGGTAQAYSFVNTNVSPSKTWRVMRMVNPTADPSGYKWQGCGRVMTIPADSGGVTGATDFSCTGRLWFENGAVSQLGIVEMALVDDDNHVFAKILVNKQNSGTIVANASMYAGGQLARSVNFNATKDSGGGTKSKPDGAICQIVKEGATFKFNFSSTTGSITVPELENTKCMKVVCLIAWYAKGSSSNITAKMYWKSLKFVKNNVEYEYDVPNRYQDGDVLTIDGNNARAYKNDVPCMDDEVIGTEYFKALPGNNVITIMGRRTSNRNSND